MFKIVSGATIVALSMTTAVQAQVQAQAQSVAAQPVQATVAPAAIPAATATPAALNATRVEAPVAGAAVLPSNTEVLLRLDEEVNSKRMRVGDTFKLSVLQDIMLGNYVVIPRGTPASGTITYRTGKGGFGKSAKMEITMNAINLNGRSIPLTGNFRQEGEGNTGAAVGAALATATLTLGLGGLLVTGRSAVFQNGREFRVATREAIPVTLPN
jgi:hypothetical protein